MNRIVTEIVSFYRQVVSAIAVSAAVESRRTPEPHHLRRLGIDPRAFLSIGHG
jgi:hypothetical protein